MCAIPVGRQCALVEKAVGQSRPEARMSAMLSPLCTPTYFARRHGGGVQPAQILSTTAFCCQAAPRRISPRHQNTENVIYARTAEFTRPMGLLWLRETAAMRLGKRAANQESKGAYIWPKRARGETLSSSAAKKRIRFSLTEFHRRGSRWRRRPSVLPLISFNLHPLH